jgi:hypothetical protein
MLTDGVRHNYTVKVWYKRRDHLSVPRGDLLSGEFIVASEIRLHTEREIKDSLRLHHPRYEFWGIDTWEEEEVQMTMETIDHITEVNTISRTKRCFMVVRMYQRDKDAYRDENHVPQSWAPREFTPASMKRLIFQVDGFTMMDFQDQDTGQLTILSNSYQLEGKRLPEDEVFQGEAWKRGNVVTWPDLKAAIRRYCELAAGRLKKT